MLELGVRVRARVMVNGRTRDLCGTKRLGTQRLGYEMSGSRNCFILLGSGRPGCLEIFSS